MTLATNGVATDGVASGVGGAEAVADDVVVVVGDRVSVG
jgi:hypothetical protein